MNGRIRSSIGNLTIPAAEGLRLGQLVARLGVQIQKDNIRAHAGNLAFRGLFSIFAVFIVAFALLALFQARDLVDRLLETVSPAIPGPVLDTLRDQILATTMESTQRAISIGTAVSIIVAIYGLSAAARAVIDGLNTIYEVKERRPLLARYLTSVVMAVTVIGLLLGAALLLAVGPSVAAAVAGTVGLEGPAEALLTVLRWPVLLAFVLLAYALIYAYAPAVSVPFRFITHGAVTAVIGWLLFTLAFSLYVENFASFNATYGAVSGIAVLLLYMYFSSLIMLIGAEINETINDQRDPDRVEQTIASETG